MSRLALSFPWLLLLLVGGWIVIDQTRGRETEHVEVAAARDSSLLDPVCGMSVTADTAFRADVDGKEYHFCAAVCRDRFLGAAAKEEQGTVAVDL
ncbi:MAG: YHS domain-containing protein, partial [Planctomycetota bacterium]